MRGIIYIYGLVDPRDGAIYYVGRTKQPLYLRLNQHIQKAKKKWVNNKRARWIRELLQQGMKPEIVELEQTTPAQQREREAFWIDYFRNWGRAMLNEQSANVGGTRSHVVEWTPELDARLGKEADSIIAEEIGVSRKTVSYRRQQLGIPASHDRRRMKPPPWEGGWNRVELSENIIAKLGTMSDVRLARLAGVSKARIRKERLARGVPSWSETQDNPTQFRKGNYPARWRKQRR